ncbi:MAG: hypothetical protein ACOC0U_03185 [Desulfovibrionales bacterium]
MATMAAYTGLPTPNCEVLMTVNRGSVLSVFIAIFCMAALSACAPKNKIPLTYQAAGVRSQACPLPITVTPLEDRRGRESIGEHGQDIVLFPASSIAQWASWALFDELEVAGCTVRYLEDAESPVPGFHVTGTVERLYVQKKDSAFGYESLMKLRIIALQNGEEVFNKEYAGSVVKAGMPTADNYRDLLEQTLQEILREAVLDLTAAMSRLEG